MKGNKIIATIYKLIYQPHICWLLLLLFCLVPSCVSPEDNYDHTTSYTNSQAMAIYDINITLPEGDGLTLVEQNCVTCHSLRIIEIQPALPEKVWKNTVRKMIKNFGAPIHDSLVEAQIVQYLTSMKKLH